MNLIFFGGTRVFLLISLVSWIFIFKVEGSNLTFSDNATFSIDSDALNPDEWLELSQQRDQQFRLQLFNQSFSKLDQHKLDNRVALVGNDSVELNRTTLRKLRLNETSTTRSTRRFSEKIGEELKLTSPVIASRKNRTATRKKNRRSGNKKFASSIPDINEIRHDVDNGRLRNETEKREFPQKVVRIGINGSLFDDIIGDQNSTLGTDDGDDDYDDSNLDRDVVRQPINSAQGTSNTQQYASSERSYDAGTSGFGYGGTGYQMGSGMSGWGAQSGSGWGMNIDFPPPPPPPSFYMAIPPPPPPPIFPSLHFGPPPMPPMPPMISMRVPNPPPFPEPPRMYFGWGGGMGGNGWGKR